MINEILNKYLNNEKNLTFSNYSLESITLLLKYIDEPHKKFRSVHIAGTNGKGSIAFMIAEILGNSGYKTGLYISPHLIKLTERIKINLKDIDDNKLYNYLKEIDAVVKSKCLPLPTYFDILTAAAFKYFSDESVDIAVIETGLGGRLDSTNVIIPEISIITDISPDHTHILGDTIEKITEEKCGIIKQGKYIVTSNTDESITGIIKKHAISNRSELYIYGRDYFTDKISSKNGLFTFNYMSDKYRLPGIRIRLFPEHQVKNTSTALTAINILKSNGFPHINDKIIYRTLVKIQIPGRFELLSENPLMIYDPAHNFNALDNLINGTKKLFSNKKIYYIISLMADKADDKTLNLFNAMKNQVIYFTLNDSRAFIPDKNHFMHTYSDFNIIIELMESVYNKDAVFIFTGTFRIYVPALTIRDMLIKKLQDEKSVQERL